MNKSAFFTAFLAPAMVCAAQSSAAQLLVSSTDSDTIIRYDEKGTPIDGFVAAGLSPLDGPRGMIIGPDGLLYVCSAVNNSVMRYNATTGQFVDVFVQGASSGAQMLTSPADLLFMPDGSLLVLGSTSLNIQRYDQSGNWLQTFVTTFSGGLQAPTSMTFGPDGNLYACSPGAGGQAVLRYNGTTGAFIDKFTPGSLSPRDAIFTTIAKQDVLLVLNGTGQLKKYHATTGAYLGDLADLTVQGVTAPERMAIDPDGNLVVSTRTDSRVLRYNLQTGEFLGVYVDHNSGGLNNAHALLFLPDSQPTCPADIVNTGASANKVDVADLLSVINSWGACP